MTEASLDVFERIGFRYFLPASGWIGYLVAGGWMFGYVGEELVAVALLLVSFNALSHAHHGRAAGLFSRSAETDTDQ